MQNSADAEPIIEDASLPEMDDPSPEAGEVMGAATSNKGEFMSEPPPTAEEDEVETEYPEMIPVEDSARPMGDDAAAFAAREQGNSYLRLVVAVDSGEMQVIDGSVVDGELVEQPDLTGEMAYEVVLDGRRIAGEAFADLSVASSLAPPDEPERGHHHGKLKQYDFVVRIPRGEVTQVDLGQIELELVKLKHSAELSQELMPAPGMTFSQAAADHGVEPPEVVAKLKGVQLGELPPAAAQALKKHLR